ncbi:MAG: hypothetical protein KC636_35650, partial [Myxococcales bacterium]|nr:hypothetical protein [Myxococcales bacterium]
MGMTAIRAGFVAFVILGSGCASFEARQERRLEKAALALERFEEEQELALEERALELEKAALAL